MGSWAANERSLKRQDCVTRVAQIEWRVANKEEMQG